MGNCLGSRVGYHGSCSTLLSLVRMALISLFFCQADQRVLRQLIVSYLPKLDESLKEHDIGIFVNRFYPLAHQKMISVSDEIRRWLAFSVVSIV